MRFFKTEFGRFLIAGGVNTGLTQLLYMALLFAMSYQLSYTVSYVAGIFLGYYLNSRFVFGEPLNWKKALQFPLVYAIQYVLGIALLWVMIERLHLHEMIAPLPVIVLIIPVTFLMSRFILKHPAGVGKND